MVLELHCSTNGTSYHGLRYLSCHLLHTRWSSRFSVPNVVWTAFELCWENFTWSVLIEFHYNLLFIKPLYIAPDVWIIYVSLKVWVEQNLSQIYSSPEYDPKFVATTKIARWIVQMFTGGLKTFSVIPIRTIAAILYIYLNFPIMIYRRLIYVKMALD